MLLLPNTCSIILYEAVEGLAILREEVCTIRIERFWRDLFSGCTGLFYHFFNHMEISGILDPTNEARLFSLHYVFLPIINRNQAVFQQGHNRAPIRTERNLSLEQLWIQGFCTYGALDPMLSQEFSAMVIVSDMF